MRLPLVCTPLPDEPQLSWLRRLAWENRCSVASLLDHCEIELPTFSILALGLPDDHLRLLSQATSLPVDDIRSLGLKEVFARAGEPLITPDLSPHQRGSTLAGAHINLDGRRRCSQCLIDRQGAVSVRWLHRLSTCCISHEVLLIDLRTPRDSTTERPLGVTMQPPGTSGRHRKGNQEWRKRSQPIRLDWRDRGLALAIDRILAGEDQEFADRRIPPADASRMIWATTMLLARFVEPEDLELDASRSEALRTYIARRPATRARPREPHTRLRTEHAALAAIAPSAWALSFGGRQAFQDELLDRVITRVRAKENRRGARVQSYYSRLPPWLNAGISAGMRRTTCQRLIHADLRQSGTARTSRNVKPSHVPQMLWLATFEQNFAPLMPDLTQTSGRTLCSILLLRMGPCTSLKTAARALGQRGEPSLVTPQAQMKLTDAHPLDAVFSQRICALYRRLDEMELETNYAALRAEYEHCAQLRLRETERLIHALGAAGHLTDQHEHVLMSPRGRAALAAWIWVHATSSRPDKSPLHGTSPTPSTARARARITARILDPNRDVLLRSLEAHHGMPLLAPQTQSLI